MKKFFAVAIAILFMAVAFGQTSIDDIYKKYNGKSGFTSISMGNDLLKFAAALDPDDDELQQISNKFEGIKLLVSSKFCEELDQDFNEAIEAGGYLKLMEVNDENDIVKFYAKPGHGDDYVNFAMIVLDGSGEQVLMSISGNFTADDLAKLGEGRSDSDYLSLLRKLESNK